MGCVEGLEGVVGIYIIIYTLNTGVYIWCTCGGTYGR